MGGNFADTAFASPKQEIPQKFPDRSRVKGPLPSQEMSKEIPDQEHISARQKCVYKKS